MQTIDISAGNIYAFSVTGYSRIMSFNTIYVQ